MWPDMKSEEISSCTNKRKSSYVANFKHEAFNIGKLRAYKCMEGAED